MLSVTDRTRPLHPVKGLWIDCPPRTVSTPEYWDTLKDLGISTAAVMATRSDRWEVLYRPERLEAIGRYAIERDMELVITVWPRPGQLAEMAADLPLLLSTGAAALEVDLEGQWRGTTAEQDERLIELFGYARERHDVRVEVTTHAGHRESGPDARITPSADRLTLQLYSTRYDWRGRPVAWDAPGGPGRAQRRGLERASTIPDCPVITPGLAAWGQQWPGHTIEEAMQTAYDAALVAEPQEVRWWSSKWVVGAKANPRVREWIRTAGPAIPS